MVGANVEIMTPDHHDLVLAITSYVPHLIAYNIVGTAADLEEVTRNEVIKFSAGGFRDFTRIAASDPTMWRDVFLYNREAVLEMLGRFTEDLTALQRMIRRGDGDGLFELFTRTRAIRTGIVSLGQETSAPDFGRRAAVADLGGAGFANGLKCCLAMFAPNCKGRDVLSPHNGKQSGSHIAPERMRILGGSAAIASWFNREHATSMTC